MEKIKLKMLKKDKFNCKYLLDPAIMKPFEKVK